jgi:hypothetical protein
MRGVGLELLLERVAPAVTGDQSGNPSVGGTWGAGPGEFLMSGDQFGDGAVRGCAVNDNHLHPPFRAVVERERDVSGHLAGIMADCHPGISQSEI